MAKIRMRHRNPENKNTKVTIVRGIKGTKLHNRLKLVIISLMISLVLNAYLFYLLNH